MTPTHRAAARTARAGELNQEVRHGPEVAREQLPGRGGVTDALPRWSAVWLRLRAGWCLANGGHVWSWRLRRAGVVQQCACGAVRLGE